LPAIERTYTDWDIVRDTLLSSASWSIKLPVIVMSNLRVDFLATAVVVNGLKVKAVIAT
jgi:hypothetical protein